MKLPSHIIWDWNGTLQNDVHAAVNGINALLSARNMPLVTLEQHREIFSFPVRNYYIALGFNLEKENWTQMSLDFSSIFLNDKSTSLFPRTKDTLKKFFDKNIPMSILSASEESSLKQAIASYEIDTFFHNIRGLTDFGAGSKTDIGIKLVNEISQQCNLDEIYLIGDTSHDKLVADTIGCKCILLADGYESRKRLEQCNCPVLDNVSNVPEFFGI